MSLLIVSELRSTEPSNQKSFRWGKSHTSELPFAAMQEKILVRNEMKFDDFAKECVVKTNVVGSDEQADSVWATTVTMCVDLSL